MQNWNYKMSKMQKLKWGRIKRSLFDSFAFYHVFGKLVKSLWKWDDWLTYKCSGRQTVGAFCVSTDTVLLLQRTGDLLLFLYLQLIMCHLLNSHLSCLYTLSCMALCFIGLMFCHTLAIPCGECGVPIAQAMHWFIQQLQDFRDSVAVMTDFCMGHWNPHLAK